MDDLISRQEALDLLSKDLFGGNAERIIANMASAQPQWIPVSERLPEVDESVLVTTEWNDISIGWRIGIDEWFIHDGSTNATTDDLIAWMPLPEPYKGGEQESEIHSDI